MKNGRCPGCSGTEIFHQPGHHAQSEKITLKTGVLSKGTAPDRYVCGSCGRVELYLVEGEDLDLVRQTWERVSVQG